MTQDHETHVRAFDGSLSDAKGLLAVERATFNESPYSAPQVQDLLGKGSQRAWVVVGQGKVVGFAIAFATYGLSGPCWEIDLLAVHPRWRGQGLAARLIRAAVSASPESARRARAVVATDNDASIRAFVRAGFQPAPEICTLLIYRPADAALRPRRETGVQVQGVDNLAEAACWLDRFRPTTEPALACPGGQREPTLDLGEADGTSSLSLLLARQDGKPAGYAELIRVQTLLYRGAWIESLAAPARAVREALIEEALRRGIAAAWDEVGAMVPKSDWALRNILRAQGFRSLGDFYWLVADLPLPVPDPRHQAASGRGREPGDGHV